MPIFQTPTGREWQGRAGSRGRHKAVLAEIMHCKQASTARYAGGAQKSRPRRCTALSSGLVYSLGPFDVSFFFGAVRRLCGSSMPPICLPWRRRQVWRHCVKRGVPFSGLPSSSLTPAGDDLWLRTGELVYREA
ncbi:hypothetical protein BKA81DRAFT_396881 [Phyllosticta paracitricarpa]